MKRLKIYLNYVEKKDNKIHNVVSYVIKNDRELAQRLSLHDGNIKKFEFANLKV